MLNSTPHYTQSKDYTNYMKKIGWMIIPLNRQHFAYVKKIPFIKKSIIKIPRTPVVINYSTIDELAKKYRALIVKLEPGTVVTDNNVTSLQILKDHGFYADKFPILQTKTIVVDLKLTQTQLLASFRPETRHHLKKSWTQNLLAEISTNDNSVESTRAFKAFYDLFERCARERKFYSPFRTQMQALWDSFGNKAAIILVYEKGGNKPLSGALILTRQNTAYYKFGASTPLGRKHFSSYFLFWEMIKWAKEKGLNTFDLEGIYDSRYQRTRKYHGITQFKRGWSKNEVTYLGSFSKYYALPLKLLAKVGIMV